MKPSNLIISLLLGVMILLGSCGRRAKLTKSEVDSLKAEYVSLLAPADTAWKIMMDEDDEKLFYLKRLLQEVSYTNEYDTIQYTSLMTRLEELKVIRYDQYTVSDSKLIDKYDSVTIQLVPEILNFASSHPMFGNYPLMAELIYNIRELDNNVLFKRADYDREAKKLNEYLTHNEDALADNLPDLDRNKKPLFEIPAE